MKLFKKILVTVLIMNVTVLAYSQVKFDLGIKGGLNFSSVNVNNTIASNYNNKTGYHFGVYTMFKFTKIAIQPEVIFSRQGNTFKLPNTTTELENSFDYINIPVIVKLYLVQGLNLQVGPQIGFLASSKGTIIDKAKNLANSNSQGLEDFMNTTDISLALGAGWDFPFGLNISARYNMGLSDINKYTSNAVPSQLTSLGTENSKNQVIQISVGFKLFSTGRD